MTATTSDKGLDNGRALINVHFPVEMPGVDAGDAHSTEADLRRDVLVADIIQRIRRPLPEIPAGVQSPATFRDWQTVDIGWQSRPKYPKEIHVNESSVPFRQGASTAELHRMPVRNEMLPHGPDKEVRGS